MSIEHYLINMRTKEYFYLTKLWLLRGSCQEWSLGDIKMSLKHLGSDPECIEGLSKSILDLCRDPDMLYDNDAYADWSLGDVRVSKEYTEHKGLNL